MKRLVMDESGMSLKVYLLWAQVKGTHQSSKGFNLHTSVCVGVWEQYTVFTVHLFLGDI